MADWVWITIAGLLVVVSVASGLARLRAGDLFFQVERAGDLGRRGGKYRLAGLWRRRVAAAKLLPAVVVAVAFTDGDWSLWLVLAGVTAFVLGLVEQGVQYLGRELVSATG